MPLEPGVKHKNAVSATGVVRIFQEWQPDYTFIEEVFSSPQMGSVSSFNFGASFGILKGASASRSVLTLVRPQVWKQKTSTPADKNHARRRAQQLFPDCYDFYVRVKDDGRAESSIIAFYGLLSLGLTPPKPLTLFKEN